MPEYLQEVPEQIKSLRSINKNGINLVAIMNLGLMKKLAFIEEKMKEMEGLENELGLVSQEVEYWK